MQRNWVSASAWTAAAVLTVFVFYSAVTHDSAEPPAAGVERHVIFDADGPSVDEDGQVIEGVESPTEASALVGFFDGHPITLATSIERVNDDGSVCAREAVETIEITVKDWAEWQPHDPEVPTNGVIRLKVVTSVDPSAETVYEDATDLEFETAPVAGFQDVPVVWNGLYVLEIDNRGVGGNLTSHHVDPLHHGHVWAGYQHRGPCEPGATPGDDS